MVQFSYHVSVKRSLLIGFIRHPTNTNNEDQSWTKIVSWHEVYIINWTIDLSSPNVKPSSDQHLVVGCIIGHKPYSSMISDGTWTSQLCFKSKVQHRDWQISRAGSEQCHQCLLAAIIQNISAYLYNSRTWRHTDRFHHSGLLVCRRRMAGFLQTVLHKWFLQTG